MIATEILAEDFKKVMEKQNDLLKIQGVKNKDWLYFLDLTWFLPIDMLIRLDKYRYIQAPEQEEAEINEENFDSFLSFERSEFDKKHNRYLLQLSRIHSSYYHLLDDEES